MILDETACGRICLPNYFKFQICHDISWCRCPISLLTSHLFSVLQITIVRTKKKFQLFKKHKLMISQGHRKHCAHLLDKTDQAEFQSVFSGRFSSSQMPKYTMWQWYTTQAFSHKSVPTWGKLTVFWKSFKRLPYFTCLLHSQGFFHHIFIVFITLIICSAEKSIIPHYNWVFKDITNAEGSVIFCSIFLVRNTGCQAMTWVLRGMNDRSILSQKMGLCRYSLFC